MSSYETLEFSVADRIARVVLNRPAVANGLNDVMAAELAHAATLCDSDACVKAVILTGSGKFFSAGGDLKAMAAQAGKTGPFVKGMADNLHRAISTFARMDAPLIVAVNGIAAGGGFSLAIAGDLVIASDTASFTMAYSKAGLSPDGSSSYYLPRLVGLRRAQELMLTNRTLSAAEAGDWGLVTQVVPADQLSARAETLAQGFAQGARGSNSSIKKLLLATWGHSLETQMELEGRAIAKNIDSRDGQEGLSAFLAKRPPAFD